MEEREIIEMLVEKKKMIVGRLDKQLISSLYKKGFTTIINLFISLNLFFLNRAYIFTSPH
jgi:hypothetical protein